MSRFRASPSFVIGVALTAFFVTAALASLVWTPEVPTRVRIALRLKPALAAGLLGTDHYGRDVV